MTFDPRRTAPHTPDWTVLGVLAEGDGLPEFSYTIGLHDRGLPELFLWAAPSDGLDPGDDWSFRDLERGLMLNQWASALINGELHPGMTWSEEMDMGLATVTFTTGELVDPLEVEALMAAPSAKVMPIRFSLRRDLLREPGEVDPQATAAIRRWTAEVVAALTTGRGARPPVMLLPGPDPDVSAGQEFGPATSLVRALRAAVAVAGTDELETLALLSISMDTEGFITAERVVGATKAVARAVGLHEEWAAADRAAMGDAHRRASSRPVRRAFAEFMGEPPGTAPGEKAIGILTRRVGNALGAAYTAAVVVDVLQADVRKGGLFPALTALTAGSMPSLWFDDAVRARVRSELADLSMRQVAALCRSLDDLCEEVFAVHVTVLIGPGDTPPAAVLLEGTRTLERLAAFPAAGLHKAHRSLEEVARAFACPDDLPAAAAVRQAFEAARRP
jgi:hypothetical protein